MAEILPVSASEWFAESDFRQLKNVTEAFIAARSVMLSAAGSLKPDALLNMARHGSSAEPQGVEPDERPVWSELVVGNNSPLAHALAERAAELVDAEPDPEMFKRAVYVLEDIWNGDPDTLKLPNSEHLAYIQGVKPS